MTEKIIGKKTPKKAGASKKSTVIIIPYETIFTKQYTKIKNAQMTVGALLQNNTLNKRKTPRSSRRFGVL
ncbi:hypothetical protein EFM01_11025 [Lactococcus lactis]|uniref:hypothetical protein n=1 Tax=Lactococcus lactis TaxID=1358 RepID=UPI00064031DA|nr:hypothetical protein [Lactococcus lactis]MBS7067707.1 hypothetical protein [Lactococcus lactis]MCT1172198.1 hypothetical protein [Lactococcus lactis]MDV4192410.1 hypothetical protein [Lactococcus lactis subsp. lactis]